MARKPNYAGFIPPEVAAWGNRFVIRWQQSAKNLRTYHMWWQLFYTAATSCFAWQGLPDEIDTRWLEQALFFNGSVALTKLSPMESPFEYFVSARYSAQGMPDIYGNPNTIRMVSDNSRVQWVRHANRWVDPDTRRLMPADAVICWDSLQRLPLFDAIDLICTRLAEMDVTIDQNVRAQRVPFIITAPEEGKKNAEAMFKRIDAGEPAIYMNPVGSVVGLQVYQSGVTYVVDKLLNDQLKLVSQGYTLLGIDNNAAAEKKERVQTAETLANNEQFMVQRRSRLQARAMFCDGMSRTFGKDVACTWAIPHLDEDAGTGGGPDFDDVLEGDADADL